jgi:hypothetical protein
MLTRVLAIALTASSLAACATHKLDVQQAQVKLSNGQPVDIIYTQAVNPVGIDTASIAYGLCKPNEKCEFHTTDYGNPGIGKTLLPALANSAALVGSAALVRPPQYNSNSLLQIQGSQAQANGGESTSSAGAGASSASNSGANVSGHAPPPDCNCSQSQF